MQSKLKYTKIVKNFMELLIWVIDPHLIKKLLLEVNILTFQKIFTIKISRVISFIRGKKFKNIDQLKQIDKDI